MRVSSLGRVTFEGVAKVFRDDVVDPLDELSEHRAGSNLLMLYFTFFHRPEDARRLSKGTPAGVTGAELFREREKKTCTAGEREILDALIGLPLSFFEVVAIEGKTHVQFEDLFTGRVLRVEDHGAAVSAELHNILCGRVFEIRGQSFIDFASPLPLPAEARIPVVNMREAWREEGDISQHELCGRAGEILTLYADLDSRVFNGLAPRLYNSDGHELVPAKLYFKLVLPPREALEKLRELDEWAGEASWNEKERKGEVVWMRKDDSAAGNTVLGRIEVSEGKLVAEVNSRERAKLVRARVRALLGEGCTYSRALYRSMVHLMSQGAGKPSRSPREMSPDDTAAMQEALRNYMAEHSRKWVDTKIPALDGQTPREAIRTSGGLEKVEALLSGAEEMAKKASGPLQTGGLDVPLIRSLLGI